MSTSASTSTDTPAHHYPDPAPHSDYTPASKSDYSSVPAHAPVPSNTYDPPVSLKPLVDPTTLFRDAAGNTYSVSNHEYSRLVLLKSALTPKEARIENLQVQQVELGNKITRDRIHLDNTSQY